MRCPYCSREGTRAELHRHLVEEHAEQVDFHQTEDRMFYAVRCPLCTFRLEQRVKPRWRDPEFLRQFQREITLVAFDQLLYHLEGVHG